MYSRTMRPVLNAAPSRRIEAVIMAIQSRGRPDESRAKNSGTTSRSSSV